MASIYSYLEAQKPEDLDELYDSPWCCLAVFQSLDPLAKQLVMRMLSMKGFIARSFLAAWMKPSEAATTALTASISKLVALSILGGPDETDEDARFKALHLDGVAEECTASEVLALHTVFRSSLQTVLTTADEVPWEEATTALPPLRAAPALSEIENYAASRWNAILHFLVGSPDAPMPDPKMIELLVSTRLLAPGKAVDAPGGGLGEEDAGAADGQMDAATRAERARQRFSGDSGGTGASRPGTRGSSGADGAGSAGAGAGEGSAGSTGGPSGAGAGTASASSSTSAAAGSSSSAAASSASAGPHPPPERKRMTYAEIVSAGGGAVHITRSGYEFLLRDTTVQLWTFINEYLRTGTARGMKVTDILAFLFELGLCRLGEGYAVAALAPAQRTLLADFASFGLVYVPPEQQVLATEAVRKAAAEARALGQPLKREFRRFFPTSLAIILTQPETTAATLEQAMKASQALAAASSAGGGSAAAAGDLSAAFSAASLRPPASAGSESGKLWLVVEKNFKVYAYTHIDLHLALLALFAKIEVRLPNLVVATLTRRSVITAMEKGITAAAIYHFLAMRAHPAVTLRGPPVPENVVDQLFLWEKERHRVIYRPGVILHAFDSDERFSACEAYVRDALHALLWSNAKEREMVVAESAFDTVKQWLAKAGTAPGAAGTGAGAASGGSGGVDIAASRRL